MYDMIFIKSNRDYFVIYFIFSISLKWSIFAKEGQEYMRTLKTISLFTGCGGLDLGFLGGFTFKGRIFTHNPISLVLSNEIDPAIGRIYDSNSTFFSHNVFVDDVKNIKNEHIPSYDILLAGFPCQPFSNAGQRKGVDDYRGTLYKECERFLIKGNSQNKKPIAFVFENVKGILSSRVPNGLSVPDEIVRLTKKLGYNTKYKLVNSCHYGVPSNRQRVVMVGIRDDYPEFDFDLLDIVRSRYHLASSLTNPFELTVGSILCDIPPDSPQRNDYWKFSPGAQAMVEMIGPCYGDDTILSRFKEELLSKKPAFDAFPRDIFIGRSWKNIPPELMPSRFRRIWDDPKRYHSPNFYRRFALGEINGTITASAQPENCGITHPFLNRRYSIREIARIQSFPDNFTFPYRDIQDAYKVIGNAVPPILGWVIARALVIHLTNINYK